MQGIRKNACMCGICATCKRRTYDQYRWRTDPTRRAQSQRRIEKWRKKKQEYVFQYLAQHPCVDCNESDPIVLEFDHVRGVKICPVSKLITGHGKMAELIAEIEKCDVRCANCHRRKTYYANEYVINRKSYSDTAIPLDSELMLALEF
jgi:hypothetical protein